MSIRQLAIRVYEAMRRVEKLERALAAADPGDRPRLEAELWKARKERDRLARILDSKKRSR